MENKFLPIFVVNRSKNLENLEKIKHEKFGVLATFQESNNFLSNLRKLDKTYFIDSGVFYFSKDYSAYSELKEIPWYLQVECFLENNFFKRRLALANENKLREFIQQFLSRCDQFTPDYALAPDIINEPLLSLYLAKLALEEYNRTQRSYQLIGVAQVGYSLYHHSAYEENYQSLSYMETKHFLSGLISEYRHLGYKYLALGGLLKSDSSNPTGLKFGLSNSELDQLLSWSRPDFVLGGLSLSRLPILKKYQIWADSSGWIWWDKRYDLSRFKDGRDPMKEVFAPVSETYSAII